MCEVYVAVYIRAPRLMWFRRSTVSRIQVRVNTMGEKGMKFLLPF